MWDCARVFTEKKQQQENGKKNLKKVRVALAQKIELEVLQKKKVSLQREMKLLTMPALPSSFLTRHRTSDLH